MVVQAGTAPRTRIDNVAVAVVGDRNDSRRGLGVDEPVRSEGDVPLDPSSNVDDDGDIERDLKIAKEVLDRRLDEFRTEYPAVEDRVPIETDQFGDDVADDDYSLIAQLCGSKVVEELHASDFDISSLEDPSEDKPTPVQRVDPSEGEAPDQPEIFDSSERDAPDPPGIYHYSDATSGDIRGVAAATRGSAAWCRGGWEWWNCGSRRTGTCADGAWWYAWYARWYAWYARW